MLGSALLILAIFEAAALTGLVDYRVLFRTFGDEPWANPLNVTDPVLLHRHRPRFADRGIQVGGDISRYLYVPEPQTHAYDVQYDDHGFRNPSPLESAEIAVAGDSFVESIHTTAPKLFTSRLAVLLDRPVANLGQLWYGPQQICHVIENYAVPLAPSVVVWAFFPNDLTDFRRYEDMQPRFTSFLADVHNPWRRSFVRNTLSLTKRLLTSPPPRAPAPVADCPHGRQYFFYPDVPLNSEDLRALRETVELMVQTDLRLRQIGSRLVVAFLPTKFMAYRDLCTFGQTSTLASWTGSALAKLLKDALADRAPRVTFVDLTPALKKAATQERVYMVDDTHWTAAGHDAVAHALLPALR